MVNIYVGNLSYNTTEDDLRSMFEAHGKVDRASVVTDRMTGRARGFGFVEMPNDAEAKTAISASSRTLLSRPYGGCEGAVPDNGFSPFLFGGTGTAVLALTAAGGEVVGTQQETAFTAAFLRHPGRLVRGYPRPRQSAFARFSARFAVWK
jgi:RNA recognition motif-containing protein